MGKSMRNYGIIVDKMSKDTISRKMVYSVESEDNSYNYSMCKFFNTIFKSYNWKPPQRKHVTDSQTITATFG